jgi:hypothetical protein
MDYSTRNGGDHTGIFWEENNVWKNDLNQRISRVNSVQSEESPVNSHKFVTFMQQI